MKINIIEYFEDTIQKEPLKTAIIDGENRITFYDLRRKSKVLSSFIKSKNKPIGVFLSKSIESVIANIGILYSGNPYMNLDIKTPTNRIRNIIELIQPEIIITNENLADLILTAKPDQKLLIFQNVDFSIDYNSSSVVEQIDTDPLCIINTSGSTGTPKGVILNHRSFIDFTEWAIETLKIADDEIIGSLSPLVFDIYSFELCMLMSKGSTIVIIPESYSPFPAKILQLMQTNRVNFIFWVPTIMVNIANMDLLDKIKLSDLRTIWFAGEVFPTKQFKYWYRALPNAKFVNLYGPIEITLDCTYYIINSEPNDDEPIPIGFPCRNTDILILNDNEPVKEVNEVGELCVRGSSLAMGYYNNQEKTQNVFVQNPLNNSYPEIIYRTGDMVSINSKNEIIFIGRKDSLIKHMGYRIELGEIEHVIINTLKIIDNGCVIYNNKTKEITLFYESTQDITINELKKTISNFFPKYMIPTVYIKVDSLPRNVNGKIDRLLLNNRVNNGDS